MILLEWSGWIAFILSVSALYLNVRQNVYCFYIWSVTDVAWIIIDINAKIWSQSAIMVVNLLFAAYGIIHWRRLRNKKHS